MAKLQYLINPTEFSDWPELHKLLNDCFAFMDGRIDPPSSLKRMTPQSLRQKAEEETLVLVYCEEQLVGCGFLKETDETVYIGKLAVKPAYRKRGILRSIVEIAENLARDQRKAGLELEARIELVENHRTFGALGFVKVGESSHAGYNHTTSITMKKSL